MGDYNDAFMRNQNAALQARTKTQNRANVQQLKLMGASHPTGLTPQLLKLFEPRPPLEYKPPPEKRKCPPLTGMGQFVSKFAEPGDPEYAPPIQTAETPTERRERIHKLRLEKGAEKAAEELQNYDPTNDPNVSGDPYKTLFVARLNYETTESRIKREFESYGPIKRVRLVTDKVSNKPRGYAFIEYVHTRDMKAAYKQADGRKLDGRRVLVDVERGRTVPNWRPRRLGGGLGTTRVGGEEVNQRNSGREQVHKRKSRKGSCLNSAESKDAGEVKNKKQKKGDGALNNEEEKKAKAEDKVEKKVPKEPPTGYIHVRARRGQATDSHSLAERVRREKISERMKILQHLVPGCDKVTGKALMLDEIINYVQSLQNQVEFLSMKLASVNPLFYDYGVDQDAFMIRPERLSSMASPLASMPQCSPTQAPPFADTSTTFVTANSYAILDSSAASASLLLQQGQRPNAFSQDNGSLLWDVDDQRQKFLDPTGFSNNLCSLN